MLVSTAFTTSISDAPSMLQTSWVAAASSSNHSNGSTASPSATAGSTLSGEPSASACSETGSESQSAPPIKAAPAAGPMIQRHEAAAAPPAAPPAMADCMVNQLGAAIPGAFSNAERMPCSKPPPAAPRFFSSSRSLLTVSSISLATTLASCGGPLHNLTWTSPLIFQAAC